MNTHDVYLGDGVYASWDGFHVWLDLRAQDNTTRIALDPYVRRNLLSYMSTMEQMGLPPSTQSQANNQGKNP